MGFNKPSKGGGSGITTTVEKQWGVCNGNITATNVDDIYLTKSSDTSVRGSYAIDITINPVDISKATCKAMSPQTSSSYETELTCVLIDSTTLRIYIYMADNVKTLGSTASYTMGIAWEVLEHKAVEVETTIVNQGCVKSVQRGSFLTSSGVATTPYCNYYVYSVDININNIDASKSIVLLHALAVDSAGAILSDNKLSLLSGISNNNINTRAISSCTWEVIEFY